MKHAAILTLFLATASFAVAGGKPINPPQFIPVNVPGATATFVGGINNAGVMVGEYLVGQHGHCFVATNGKVTTIDKSGAYETSCSSINSSGAIVGTYYTTSLGPQAFLYQNGQFIDIGPGTNTFGSAINDAGQIVGEYEHGTTSDGFLWDGSAYQIIDVPGATDTAASGINNHGLIVLRYGAIDGGQAHNHAALYDGLSYMTIDVPGASDTTPGEVNNLGDVVFTWLDSQNGTHAALMHSGTFYKFMVPGSNRTFAAGVNDFDVIVGSDFDHTKFYTPGYKLIP